IHMDSNQPSPIVTLIVFILLVVGIIVAGVFVFLSRPEPAVITINPPEPTATSAPTSTPEPITVYVTGAVNQAQTTVIVPFDSRVRDVIEQVGGFTEDANLDLVNLAGIVRDGDQIHVPSLNPVEDIADNTLPTPSGGDVIYINTATIEELQTLPGIGESTAQAIIDYRTENGAFTSLDDLDEVSGIGEATLETLEPLISFD
ncbi:MAG: helix-hairpin-helix domain-containing protein, partial [Chloroflexota bacterium]